MRRKIRSIPRRNHKLQQRHSFERRRISFAFLGRAKNGFGYRFDVRRRDGMRKPGTGAIHRCRHEGDGIGREGRMWKIFHALGSLNCGGDRYATAPSVPSTAATDIRAPDQDGSKSFHQSPGRLPRDGRGDLIGIFVRGISHEISNSRQSRTEVVSSQRWAVTRRASRIFVPRPPSANRTPQCRARLAWRSQRRRLDLQAVSLGECRRLTGLNLGAKAGKAITEAPRSVTTAGPRRI